MKPEALKGMRHSHSVLRMFIALALLMCAGCAVHYFDSNTGTEHIWGIGHMAMKIDSPNEGVKAVGARTDTFGVSIGRTHKEAHLGIGWDARQRIEVLDENAALSFTWPEGSFYNFRAGSSFPPYQGKVKTTATMEGEQ